MFIIRKATLDDVADIFDIQCCTYPPEQVESYQTFVNIILEGVSFVACNTSDKVIGYILCHYWGDLKRPPRLHGDCGSCGGEFGTVGDPRLEAECIFIHDLCIHPYHRKKYIGTHLYRQATEYFAKNSGRCEKLPISLVAVKRASGFWAQFGFVEKKCDVEILKSYEDPSAVFMVLE